MVVVFHFSVLRLYERKDFIQSIVIVIELYDVTLLIYCTKLQRIYWIFRFYIRSRQIDILADLNTATMTRQTEI